MIVRYISITNFRGIRQMAWSIDSEVTCLIGPGDSTKTTILDAIEYCLFPYYNLTIDDSDFFNSNSENSIEISVTVTKLPDEIIADQKYGLLTRGWNKRDGLHDEPQAGDEIGITISFKVDDALEPSWTVINDRSPGKTISHVDRAKLCVNRLSSIVDRHLSWAKGSILHRMTEDINAASSALATATRQMRGTTNLSTIEEFKKVAEVATAAAARFGIKPKQAFIPQLDSKALSTGISAISIHDGGIPLRASGLGTRRLMALGLQTSYSKHGAIVLVDEVEEGLEPYRLRHLLRELAKLAQNNSDISGQVVMTTHSPIATVEIPASSLTVVRSNKGITTCKSVPTTLQGTVRAVTEALLAPRVIVCEGKTEYGLCRGLEKHWCLENKESLSYMGVALVEGGGDAAPARASELADLGYSVCLFIDSDCLQTIRPTKDELIVKGVQVIHWDGAFSIEQRIAFDVPIAQLQIMLDIAANNHGEQSVRDCIRKQFPQLLADKPICVNDWLAAGVEEVSLREAVGTAAKEKKWFKRIDYGEELGEVVCQALSSIPDKNLTMTINNLSKWVNPPNDNTAGTGRTP